jgi:hypothetical protein
MMMKKLFLHLAFISSLLSCSKKPTEEIHGSEMNYIDLKDARISYNTYQHVDLDNDNKTDFTFLTLLVGDPLLNRDELHFYATSKIHSLLLNDEHDESPVLSKDQLIKAEHQDFTWYEVSSILLVEKQMYKDDITYWDGLWKNVNHRYLPVQIKKEGKPYFGWIELSFDKETEVLILHKAAISKEPYKTVKAGC